MGFWRRPVIGMMLGTVLPKSMESAKRLVRVVVGLTLLLVGLLLLVLPGPAFIVIPIALAILAGEFVWARVLLARVRHHLQSVKNQMD